MKLEGMIRNPTGAVAVKVVNGTNYQDAKTKLLALVAEGSVLLYIRAL